jgi:hypothetical protein
MAKRARIILCLILSLGLSAWTVYAQGEGPDPAAITKGFGDLRFWAALLATLVAGALGGIVYELLILQGNLELPHRPTDVEVGDTATYALSRNMYDLGIWARVIIGALAAVGAMLALTPTNTFALLATAIVAGSAGTSIFRSLQDRFAVAIAEMEVAQTKQVAERQQAKLEQAAQLLSVARGQLAADEGLESVGPIGLSEARLSDLDKVQQLLSEARGLYEGL